VVRCYLWNHQPTISHQQEQRAAEKPQTEKQPQTEKTPQAEKRLEPKDQEKQQETNGERVRVSVSGFKVSLELDVCYLGVSLEFISVELVLWFWS